MMATAAADKMGGETASDDIRPPRLTTCTFITAALYIMHLYSPNKVAMYINEQINKQKEVQAKRNDNVQ